MTTYYEDLSPGDELSFGAYEVTEGEILEFAEQYDPQWFHTDPERAAEESMYGGLIASGWHTCAMTMRMLVDHHFEDAASLGALGVDDLRWPNPTRPGETLSVHVEILDTRPSDTREDWGIARSKLTTANQDGEVKVTMEPVTLYARRDA